MTRLSMCRVMAAAIAAALLTSGLGPASASPNSQPEASLPPGSADQQEVATPTDTRTTIDEVNEQDLDTSKDTSTVTAEEDQMDAVVAYADEPQSPANATPTPTLPDPVGPMGLDGAPLEPRHDVSELKAEQETAPDPVKPTIVEGYRTSGVRMRSLSMASRPYGAEEALVPIAGYGLVDKQGVRMFRMAGDSRLWEHPVAQAQYALLNLESYRRTGTKVYLDRARANAQRLIDRRVESRGGWFYPYDFDFAVHGDTTQTLRAPWYSAMAQGQALSAFVRLAQVTKEPRWRTAADATFQSLLLAPVEGQPLATWVSDSGDLWLEEYPRWPVAKSERVLNGHIYAAFGLYDYAQLTRSQEAAKLFDGAVTTVRRLLLSGFRRPAWASVYSLNHKLPSLSYHQIHVRQVLHLQAMTGISWFPVAANVLRSDFPLRTSAGQLVLTPKSTVAYQLDAQRRVIRSRKVGFTRQTGAPADRRERTAGGGPIMLRISAGPYTNWWFPEGAGKAWLLGAPDIHAYRPQLTITFTPGTYSAYRLDSRGRIAGSKTVAITRNSNAPTPRSAIVGGRPGYYFPVGAFAGHWMPMNSKLVVN